MLYKDLKEIIFEADEENSITDSDTEQSKKEIPKKPKKSIQNVKDASDGIGNEAYDISNKIANTLETDLTSFYNIEKVYASNNKITINAKVKKMNSGLLTSKMTGHPIPHETLLNTIRQIIIADLGDDIDNFKLDGPFEVAPGILVITVVSV